VLTAAVDNTSTLQVQCTNTTPYNIGLDAGAGSGATVAARKMTNGSATVTYSLYTDAGRATVWGNTVGTDTVAATGNGASQTYTVYGRVPAQTTPAAATYTDTVTLTVTY
jgi:spore coat protein U-like protein